MIHRLRQFLALLTLGTAVGAAATPPAPAELEGIWTGEARKGDETGFIGLEFFRAKDGVRTGTRLWMPQLNNYGSLIGELKVVDGRLGVHDFGTPLTLEGDTLRGNLYLPDLQFTLRRGGELPPESVPPADAPLGPEARWNYLAEAGLWATPALADGIAYVGDDRGRVHAVDTTDGSAVWLADTGAPIYGPVTATADALYVVNDGGHLVKLARADGRVLWRQDIGGAGIRSLPDAGAAEWDFHAPAPVVHGDTVYVGSTTGTFHALDAATGQSRWTFTSGGKIRAAAVVTADRVYFGSKDRFAYALDRATGALVWKFDTGGPVDNAPMLAGDKLVIGTRDPALLYGLDAATGAPVWSVFFWLSWVDSTAVLADDGLLYIGSSDSRRVRCLEPATGRVRWAAQVWGWTWGTPLVRGDKVYFATAGAPQYFISQRASLGALDRATGELRWRTPVPLREGAYLAGVAGSLVATERDFLAAFLDGTLRAYPLP